MATAPRSQVPKTPVATVRSTPVKEPSSLQEILANAQPQTVHERRASYESKQERELDFLARTIFGEARGSNCTAKELVAWQIRNRVEHLGTQFPHSYEGVVTQGGGAQDNCWLPPKGNRPNPNYDRVINPPAKPEDRGWKEWDDSIAAAKAVMEADASTNPIKAALYYYSPNAQKTLAWKDPMNNPVLPSWVFPENKVGDAKGADFEFYREPNARQHLEVLKRQRERKDWRETMKQLRRNPDRRDEC